jgi:hypothetical protein
MGQFTGNLGAKQIPSDPTQVSKVAEQFFGDSVFDMLCQLCICVVPKQGIVCCNITCPKIIICDRSATFKSEKHNIMRPVRKVLSNYMELSLLEKLPIVQLLRNFPAICVTQMFITVFARALHWSVSCQRRKFNTEIIGLGSLKLSVKMPKTKNQGAWNGGPAVFVGSSGY